MAMSARAVKVKNLAPVRWMEVKSNIVWFLFTYRVVDPLYGGLAMTVVSTKGVTIDALCFDCL